MSQSLSLPQQTLNFTDTQHSVAPLFAILA
jgi:hypothetical protein